MKDFRDRLGRELLLMDGAMGTMLQARGLKMGELPGNMNLRAPDVVRGIHAEYLAAGADIVEANTFGVSRLKFGDEAAKVVRAGIRIAREAVAQSGLEAYVAANIGPLGRLLKPVGDLDFEEAVTLFREIAASCEEADLLLFETFTDVYELKAALLAAKEVSDLPIVAMMTFDEAGRMLTGADVTSAVTIAESLGAEAVGFNCGLGPEQMLALLPSLRGVAGVPLSFNPNAGLPVVVEGQTQFRVSPQEFAAAARKLAEGGAALLGGCCGTTPEHIAALKKAVAGIAPAPAAKTGRTIICSYARAVEFGGAPVLIGERINPTGKPNLKRALRENDMGYVLREGAKQADAGADVLDVNVGLPGIDECEMLSRAVAELQAVLPLPLQIDSANPEAMARAARLYNGRPLLNSVSGKRASMDAVFPIAQKYGAVLIALTLDDEGIPETAAGRVSIAETILAEAEKYGIGPERLIFDPLAMSVSTGGGALATLDALSELSRRGLRTSLGVSNVSFGLPARPRLNAAFFAAALARGLSAGIVNPLDAGLMDAAACHNVLFGYDADCSGYIARFADAEAVPVKPVGTVLTLHEAVLRGLCAEARAAAVESLKTRPPMDVVEGELVPALNAVGEGFEKKTVFLPQLLMSAEAAGAAFEEVRARIAASGGETGKGTIVVATVRGDIHDIGKNIVRALLENYGFQVIDLGKDVPPEAVLEAVEKSGAPLVGLSALMTTTVESMEETIRLLHARTQAKIVVGGAVLTENYARQIGADFYARDAMATVRVAEAVFGGAEEN
ncbi:MAG TPA: homocysteine S-methyltransferase family protein [Candidatus Pullichristensenella stercorigallinarum]|uniref:Methionine synthase n=1 Tax=Candidatus Pullichristensenella stercorigallinarum TaxID=2840909 RepID=A0A9D0ZMY9_9FIRM|nr:homocysteine S-methyltransferase family protein [Candidatus Pullichristensenella stercorigallinarum]